MKFTTFCTTALLLALAHAQEDTSSSSSFSLPSGGVTLDTTIRPTFTLPFTTGSLPSLTLTGSETLSAPTTTVPTTVSGTGTTSISTTTTTESEPVTVTTSNSNTASLPAGTSASGSGSTTTDTATSAGASNTGTGTGSNGASSHVFRGDVLFGMASSLMVYFSL